MFETNYQKNNISINGKNINIETTTIDQMNEYLQKLNTKREKLIDQQNEYLSQIINLKG